MEIRRYHGPSHIKIVAYQGCFRLKAMGEGKEEEFIFIRF